MSSSSGTKRADSDANYEAVNMDMSEVIIPLVFLTLIFSHKGHKIKLGLTAESTV